MIEKCFECGEVATEQHHVVPRSKGGTKTVPLCSKCHGLVHGIKRLNISELTKAALNEKKKKGEKLGNPQGFIGQDKATETKKAKAVQNASSDKTLIIKNRIKEVIELAGFEKESLSLSIIANKLSKYTTATGKPFTTHNVVPIVKVVLKELGLTSLPKFENQV